MTNHVKVKYYEAGDSTFEAGLQTTIDALTILASTTPVITVFGHGSRLRAIITYCES